MELFLGVDAGGTHCRSRLVDSTGRILGVGSGGPANTRIGLDALQSCLLDVCAQATSKANLKPSDLARIKCGLGIAGLSRQGLASQLSKIPFPFSVAKITDDVHIANLGAHLGGDGATIILGTGSVAVIKIGTSIKTLGGYGFPIADEGSGASIGLRAIQEALRAYDGRAQQTKLTRIIFDDFASHIPNLLEWMDRATPTDYGRFAPFVMASAEDGDKTAVSIVLEASRHVELYIETALSLGAVRCSLLGGLAARIEPWLGKEARSRLAKPMADALDGALIFAGLPIASVTSRQ